MERVELEGGWAELNAEVARELSGWRAAHPQATLAELEGVVREALSRVQARDLSDLVHASAAAAPRSAAAGPGAAAGGAAGAAAQLRGVLGLRGRAFPPWMTSWRWCRAT